MLWLDPATIEERHLEMLLTSVNQAPKYERQDVFKLLEKLHKGFASAFDFPGGLIVVEQRLGHDQSRRLCVLAFAGDAAIWRREGLAASLKKLAADWSCDMIETLCYDPRLARAIQKVGGSVESVNVVLKLEG